MAAGRSPASCHATPSASAGPGHRVWNILHLFTTKHLYFSGQKKNFWVRYDRIVSFEPFSDGLGLMRDAQTAKPQSFRTWDGWFAYNLAVNLSQM